MAARFERAVERGATRPLARVGERDDLRVRPTGTLVRPAADDHAFGVDDHARRPSGSGWCVPAPALGERSARAM